jgi:hypothetical protein
VKKFLASLALSLLSFVALGQTKIELFNRVQAMPGGAVGDFYYTFDSSGTITRLPIGSVGNCLKVAAGPVPSWGACGGGGSSPLTTKGDVYGYDSADARIPIGTNGQAFIADSAQTLGLKWGTLGYAGGGTNATTSWTQGSVFFAGVSSFAQDNVHFFYDITNQRLGLGGGTASSPTYSLDVTDTVASLAVATGRFRNTTGTANLIVQTGDTTNYDAGFTLSGSRVWLLSNIRNTKFGGGVLVLCDQSVDSNCETTSSTGANRMAFDTSGDVFFQGGSANFGVPVNTATSTTNGKVGIGHVATAAGYLAVNDSACLYGTGSGNICLGLAATGGDATRYNLPITAPTSGNTLLSCGVPSSSISTCTFVSGSPSSITGSTSASFVPYSSGSNVLADSTMSWASGSGTLTTGNGGIQFKGSTSGGPTFKSPAIGGSVSWTLPITDGSTNQCVKTDGSGTLSFGGCGGASGGNIVNSTALGSEPSGSAGDVNLPTNGYAVERYNGTTWSNNWGPLYPLDLPPDDATWTWINQGATASTTVLTNQGIYLNGGTSSAALNVRGRYRSISTNTSVKMGFLPTAGLTGAANMGFMLRENATGKIATFRIAQVNGTAGYYLTTYTNASTFSANVLTNQNFVAMQPCWMRFVINGSAYEFYIGTDGQHWSKMNVTFNKTTFFTTAADQWGFFVDPQSTTIEAGMNLISWKEIP